MIESFVDLTYRSLPLGRRIKLTQVRPSTGYLELPAPMPVGTKIAISTDEGVGFDAVVTYVHEQIGGVDRQPGMTITPALGDDKASSWWKARVALPELAARPVMTLPRASAPAVIPRGRRTAEMPGVPEPKPEPKPEITPPPTAAPPVIDDGVRTTVMQAIDDPALIDQLPNDPVLLDDGKKTIVMEAVDVRALGLEPSSTGEIPVVEVGDEDSDDDKSDANGGKPKTASSRRRRGKRR